MRPGHVLRQRCRNQATVSAKTMNLITPYTIHLHCLSGPALSSYRGVEDKPVVKKQESNAAPSGHDSTPGDVDMPCQKGDYD